MLLISGFFFRIRINVQIVQSAVKKIKTKLDLHCSLTTSASLGRAFYLFLKKTNNISIFELACPNQSFLILGGGPNGMPPPAGGG